MPFGSFDMELLHSPVLPADYYRKQAARVRLLAADATAGDIKEHLQEVALQYERLAERAEDLEHFHIESAYPAARK